MDSGVQSILENMPDREDPGEDEPGPGIGSPMGPTHQSQDVDHVEIHYVDSDNGWAMTKYDDQDYQIGQSDHAFHQKDLIERAKKLNVPIEVYTKQRSLNRVIEP